MPHTVANLSDEPCRFLTIVTPAGIEDFFRAQRDYLASLPPGAPPDPAAFGALPGAEGRPTVGPRFLPRVALRRADRAAYPACPRPIRSDHRFVPNSAQQPLIASFTLVRTQVDEANAFHRAVVAVLTSWSVGRRGP
jgi:hypothetical protein